MAKIPIDVYCIVYWTYHKGTKERVERNEEGGNITKIDKLSLTYYQQKKEQQCNQCSKSCHLFRSVESSFIRPLETRELADAATRVQNL